MARALTSADKDISRINRKTYLVFNYDNVRSKIIAYHNDIFLNKRREFAQKESFVLNWNIQPCKNNVCGQNAIATISSALRSWAITSSYYVCQKCNSINYTILPPNFSTRVTPIVRKNCHCSTNRYIVPRFSDIPEPLRNLSHDNITTLRPFDIDCGNYKRLRHGYRVKTGTTKLTLSPKSVLEKIRDLKNSEDREKCLSAYRYLIKSENSKYSDFVTLRNELHISDSTFYCFNWEQTNGVECALWPNLYPFTSWCESTLCGGTSRLSSKVAFCHKLFSEISDYGLNFDLLQWQYDRSMYKIVSGAINTGRFSNCSPARALDTKPFSPTYWQWQHRYLLDAVDQFGLPDVFFTISPFEWSFPFAKWISDIRQTTGKGPTELAGYETYHISHVLEQIVRGYLCGSNNNRWTNHIFSYNRSSTQKNVKTYFYRLEFQERGTVHLHLLVWLHNITKIQKQFIRADIPRHNPELSYLVHKLQPSDKRSHCLNMQTQESFFELKEGKYVHHLKHPSEEFALKLRAYISTIIPALQCRMDYQTTDGLAMILRYVTSYVAKSHDSTNFSNLYSYHVDGRQAAIHYLFQNNPAEPEMWFSLFSKKVAWTCSRTKRYTVPTSNKVTDDKMANAYWKRKKNDESIPMLQWLRLVDTNGCSQKAYKQGSTLVGTKILSIFNNEYFFQYLLLHRPHRSIKDLLHPNNDTIPDRLKWFAAVVQHFPEVWNNEANLTLYLTLQAHREKHIATIIAYIRSLHDLYYLFQINVINHHQLRAVQISEVTNATLDTQQLALLHHINTSMKLRIDFYKEANLRTPLEMSDTEGDSDDESEESFPTPPNFYSSTNEPVDTPFAWEWQNPILVTGKPGSGKTHAICESIIAHNSKGAKILVVSPTGFLASLFRSKLPEQVTCETIHSAFHIPITVGEQPKTNWAISYYDMVVIDEISMISESIFKHILNTLGRLLYRPVLVVSGDNAQQQPFEKRGFMTVNVNNPLLNKHFISSTYHYRLNGQHRVDDDTYLNFLDHIRTWAPKQSLLDEMQRDRVISSEDSVDLEKLVQAFQKNPDTTVLTFTNKAANEINNVIVSALFLNIEPLGYVQLDSDTPVTPIFRNMRVMITQNRDKSKNVVNGQMAIVQTMHNSTIILQLPSQSIVAIHPVTNTQNEQTKTVFPIRLGYANTMCKAQGQTLKKVIIWFDIDKIPPGTAYVALSRVKTLNDISFLKPLKTHFFTPVTTQSYE